MPSTPSARPQYPIVPFSDDVPTHPLLVVDYEAVAAGDKDAIDTLYTACASIGFFYLKNHGVQPEPMFAVSGFKVESGPHSVAQLGLRGQVGEDTFDLPLEELMKFEQGDGGMSAGYKRAGFTSVDRLGNVDTGPSSSSSVLSSSSSYILTMLALLVHFINVNKHDALNFPEIYQRTYPSTCIDAMPTIQTFVRDSDTVLKTLMTALESRLGLPTGTFDKLHMDKDVSGSEVRVIRKPAQGESGHVAEGVGEGGEPAAAIGESGAAVGMG
jgi:isopenicillin N synthase-like dioxygenase